MMNIFLPFIISFSTRQRSQICVTCITETHLPQRIPFHVSKDVEKELDCLEKMDVIENVFSANGVSADPNKIKTIVNTTPPENVSEVRSFLGMTQYVSRFIFDYATMTEPLRKLIRQDSVWTWSQTEQQDFNNLKQSLTQTPVMAYFNPKQDTTVLVDASPVGLGTIMTHNGKVICYASRVLSNVTPN